MKNSRKQFLDSVREIIRYWSENTEYPNMAAQGTAFSIMCLLDGVCVDNLYGYDVVDNETGQHISTAWRDGIELHADL